MGVSINTTKHLGVSAGSRIIPPSSSFTGMIMEWTVGAGQGARLICDLAGNNYDVDWGDGTPLEIGITATDKTHTYAVGGTYEVKVSGTIVGFNMQLAGLTYQPLLTKFKQWGTDTQILQLKEMFRGCTNLLYTATDAPDISLLNASYGPQYMFSNCTTLNGTLDLSHWTNTDKFVGNCEHIFYSTFLLSGLNITGWDMSNITDFSWGFARTGQASGLTLIAPNLDFSSCTDLSYLFYRGYMINGSDISNWTLNPAAGSLNLEKAFLEYGMFTSGGNTGGSDVDLSTWNNTSAIESLFYFGNKAYGLGTINLTGWDISNVTSISALFYDSTYLTDIIGLSGLNTSSVTDAGYAFRNTRRLIFDNHNFGANFGSTWNLLGNWLELMFYRNGYSAAVKGVFPNITNWNMANVHSLSQMFKESKYATGQAVTLNWTMVLVTSTESMFYDTDGFDTIDLTGCTTSNALTNMSETFYKSDFSSITFGANWDFSGVTTVNSLMRTTNNLTDFIIDSSADFGAVTDLVNICNSNGRMTITQYDDLLIRLAATNTTPGLVMTLTNCEYTCAPSAGATAEAALVALGWTITDAPCV